LQPISLTGAKHSAFSTNHLADTDKTKNAVTTTTKNNIKYSKQPLKKTTNIFTN